MNGFGVLNFLAVALQLTVPSYGLRLVHRFGAQRVGGFLVFAFVSLALLHLLTPLKGTLVAAGSGMSLDAIGAATCGLLLIGMGHLETLCAERQRVERAEQVRLSKYEAKARQDTEDLLKRNEELAQATTQVQRQMEALTETEKQFRFLFSENPQPMWVFDLRTGQFLAVNQAALRHYGFSYAEFMRLNAKDLALPDAAEAWRQETARPCHAAERRGAWWHRKKDQTLIEMELTALDFKFSGCPARLILAQDISERRRREAGLYELEKGKVLEQIAGGLANHFNNIFTAIEGHAGLLLNQPQPPATAEQLQQISQASQRGAVLTRQLLLMVHPNMSKDRPTEFVSRAEVASKNGDLTKPLIQPYSPDQLLQTVQSCASSRNRER